MKLLAIPRRLRLSLLYVELIKYPHQLCARCLIKIFHSVAPVRHTTALSRILPFLRHSSVGMSTLGPGHLGHGAEWVSYQATR